MAMFRALDERRAREGLTWKLVASQVWDLSATLNAQRGDHPISPATITGIARRGDTTCQHALFLLRWLRASPDSFVGDRAPGTITDQFAELPDDRRPRWHLKRLYEAMNEKRLGEGLTWAELASALQCTPSQLTGLKTARFATSMVLAMRIVAWLGRPSADFIYAARW